MIVNCCNRFAMDGEFFHVWMSAASLSEWVLSYWKCKIGGLVMTALVGQLCFVVSAEI